MGEVYTGKYKNLDLSRYDITGLNKVLSNLEKSTNLTQDQRDYIASVKSELSKRGVSISKTPDGKTILFGLLAIGFFVWFYKRKK